MEIKSWIGRLSDFLMKYRYAACILLVGIILMMLPSADPVDTLPEPAKDTITAEITVEEQLSSLLSKIQGAGRVEVMLSFSSGAETRYHSDSETDTDSTQSSAVIITDGDRNETALVSRVDPPKYLGAIVLCHGADSAAVRLAIVEAVSKYTGLGADQIAVLKMK